MTTSYIRALALVEADYEWMTRQLMVVAHEHADKRIVSMLEGWLQLRGLGAGV